MVRINRIFLLPWDDVERPLRPGLSLPHGGYVHRPCDDGGPHDFNARGYGTPKSRQ